MTFGLLGKHISYSLSPRLHKTLFEAFKVHADYHLFDGDIKLLEACIEKLRDTTLKGLNVTIPYKQTIIPFLDALTPEAQATKAVNTVVFREGLLVGHNTDVAGFEHLLDYYHVEVANKTVFVLGTGGASKAVKYALEKRNASVVLVSRNANQDAITYESLYEMKTFELIINATPVGSINTPGLPMEKNAIKRAACVIDLIYNPEVTLFVKEANLGYNGYEMLYAQALHAQAFWFGYTDSDVKKLLSERV